jgi:hypothetical protein
MITNVALGNEAPAAEKVSPEQVAAWIEDLNSDSFVRREKATTRLAEAGVVALAPLAEAADSGSLEVASRAVRLLLELARNDDPANSLVALEHISKLQNRPVERAAAESMLASMRERRAIEELTRLGAEFPRSYNSAGQDVNPYLHLGESFRGSDESMQLVKELPSLQMVEIHGAAISDEGIKPLHEIKSLMVVQLYGTKATRQGADALQQALPHAEVHFRRGAFLGVQGSHISDGKGAAISMVTKDSAAQKADIRVNDVIIKYNDIEIRDFTGLTDEIAKCRPGDKASLQVRRGDETLTKEVVFGKWR